MSSNCVSFSKMKWGTNMSDVEWAVRWHESSDLAGVWEEYKVGRKVVVWMLWRHCGSSRFHVCRKQYATCPKMGISSLFGSYFAPFNLTIWLFVFDCRLCRFTVTINKKYSDRMPVTSHLTLWSEYIFIQKKSLMREIHVGIPVVKSSMNVLWRNDPWDWRDSNPRPIHCDTMVAVGLITL